MCRATIDLTAWAIQAEAIYHVTADNQILRRTYKETAARASGFAYFLKKHGYKRVGILAPNTPAFLESIFGIAAAGSINVGTGDPSLVLFSNPIANSEKL